ncbi:hypothetical protein [Paraburkholderia caribensis]|uniref:hypothetical protein n=1 Tax=Paraburkholderia caribensis TaxID=75105 RepID=UPI001D06A595|nr:hypothetical protein [Paraburkholderia caribensis]
MSGGGGSTALTNWPMMTDPLQSGVYGAVNQVWYNQQANANVWASQAKANDDANRAQHEKDVEAWNEQASRSAASGRCTVPRHWCTG